MERARLHNSWGSEVREARIPVSRKNSLNFRKAAYRRARLTAVSSAKAAQNPRKVRTCCHALKKISPCSFLLALHLSGVWIFYSFHERPRRVLEQAWGGESLCDPLRWKDSLGGGNWLSRYRLESSLLYRNISDVVIALHTRVERQRRLIT